MKLKTVLMGCGAVLALQAYAGYEWTLYDDFSSGALDSAKWSLEVENSSADPVVQGGLVYLDAAVNDGSSKIGVKAGEIAGVKADLSLGYADSGSGNEIEIGLSDGVELWLDIGMYGTIHYISAAAEDAAGEEIMSSHVTNAVYDQVYELAVVVTNGAVRCYVDDVLLGEYAGDEALSISYCFIGAWSDTDADVEGTIDNVYLLREPWDISGQIAAVEINAGYELLTSEYSVEFDLELMEALQDAVAAVTVTAPFGTFACVGDYGEWEFDASYSTNAVPEVDGEWTITLTHTNGLEASTVVAFAQADGSPIPDVTTCPMLTTPDLSGGGPVFEMADLTWEWDSAFDTNANLAAMGGWNALTDEDVELLFEPTPSMRSNGPLSLEAGTVEAWFANGFLTAVTNADQVPCVLVKFASYDFEPTVVDGEWDADQDHISNAWEYEYFGSLTNCSAAGDADGDGVSNYDEYQAGTDPTNAASLLTAAGAASAGGFEVSWAPVSGHEYRILWTDSLTNEFTALTNGLTAPQGSYTDSEHSDEPTGFYQIGAARVSTNRAVVRSAEIAVDGDGADWGSIEPQFTDPAGDSSIYSGLDVTGITLARGTSNLFVRIDRAGTDMPVSGGASIWIEIRSEVDGVEEYGINYYYDEAGGYTEVSLHEISDEWIWLTSSWAGAVAFDDSSAGIEISVPLKELQLVDHYALSCYTHHEEDGAWSDNGENWDNNTVAVIILP